MVGKWLETCFMEYEKSDYYLQVMVIWKFLASMGLQRVGHDWSDAAAAAAFWDTIMDNLYYFSLFLVFLGINTSIRVTVKSI